MELALTSVSSRRSRKAINRARNRLDSLKNDFEKIELTESKKCLMITFFEESESFINPVLNDSEIYQVEVGYGANHSFTIEDDHRLFQNLLKGTLSGISSYEFPESDQPKIAIFIQKWSNSTGDSDS